MNGESGEQNCEQSLTDKMGSKNEPTTITILHFNDVYNIEPREKDPCGGAARFTQRIKDLSDLNPLVLFSGDAFNPSLSEYSLLFIDSELLLGNIFLNKVPVVCMYQVTFIRYLMYVE